MNKTMSRVAVHGRFLRSEKTLLQNSGILRSAARTRLPSTPGIGNAAQVGENRRKISFLN